MCALAGLDVVALTDHNTAGNCAAFCRAAQRNGLLALAGMELCTREEIHMICLFPALEEALAFGEMVSRRLPPLANDPHVFGLQTLMDDLDGVLGEERALLAGAADIGVYEVPALVASFGGVAYPAHIDRPSFSLLSNLGLWDPSLGFPLAELSARCPPDFSGLPARPAGGAHHHHSLRRPLSGPGFPRRTPVAMELSEAPTHAVLEYLRGDLPF